VAWLSPGWWTKNWTLVISPLVILCNVEFVVMPLILILTSARGDGFFLIVATWATFELTYWYLVPLDRFKDLARVRAKLTIRKPTIRQLFKEFNSRGLLASLSLLWTWIQGLLQNIISWFNEDVSKHDDVEALTQRKSFKFLMGAMRYGGIFMGYLAIFCLGSVPFPFISTPCWMAGLVFCRARSWHMGYFFLALGNLLKIYIWSQTALYIASN
jgi:hypothetical protein